MTTALKPVSAPGELDAATVQQVLLSGDINRLSPTEKITYYNRVCESLGLNPLTQPFEFLTLNGKMRFYALKSCTEQLRQIHGVSLTIVQREVVEGCYVVTARATSKTGRQDESIGAVPIDKLTGESRANAMMKAETKAKRRVTLSVCGLGMLDESEVDSIPQATTTRGQKQDRVVAQTVDVLPPGPDATLERDLKASVEAGQVEVTDAKTGEVVKKPKVTREQLAKIHVLKKDGGWGDRLWKETLQKAYGTESSANLTKEQASHWIEKLQRKMEKLADVVDEVNRVVDIGETGPVGVAGAIEDALSEPPVPMASPAQIEEIGVEFARLGWKPLACAWWLKKYHGPSTRAELTQEQATTALRVLMMLADGTPCA